MYCTLVWNGNTLILPKEMGNPSEGQLVSTNLDNLIELAGRVCYDSLGKGRKSNEYHEHINFVNHGSVQEHANITFQMDNYYFMGEPCESPNFSPANFINRPGVWFDWNRITLNLRSIREWDRFNFNNNSFSRLVGNKLKFLTKKEAPLAMLDIKCEDDSLFDISIVNPNKDEEIWLSFFITNVSRGFSHELVRHKYMTAVSQRSTRYVDESESEWIYHPLIKQFNHDKSKNRYLFWTEEIDSCQSKYNEIVDVLQKYLVEKKIDKLTARKQARGAARGVLGNALMTEMIFSASLAQWKRMLLMRASEHADGEIRLVFNEIFDILSEKYPDKFQGWTKVSCSDGIGFSIKNN